MVPVSVMVPPVSPVPAVMLVTLPSPVPTATHCTPPVVVFITTCPSGQFPVAALACHVLALVMYASAMAVACHVPVAIVPRPVIPVYSPLILADAMVPVVIWFAFMAMLLLLALVILPYVSTVTVLVWLAFP